MKLFLPIIDNGMGLSRTSWAMSLVQAAHGFLRQFDLDIRHISYPYPDGAMNIICQEFLESEAEEMLLIDTDLVFWPKHLEYLFEHKELLVFGLYPKKELGFTFPAEPLDGDTSPFANPGPLVEVKHTARGFMRMHKAVLIEMSRVTNQIEHAQTGKKTFEFWKTLPGGHSEDFFFCNTWRKLGGKILVDKRIVAGHEGSVVYPIKGTY